MTTWFADPEVTDAVIAGANQGRLPQEAVGRRALLDADLPALIETPEIEPRIR